MEIAFEKHQRKHLVAKSLRIEMLEICDKT
jgi:hypothetical protein